MSGIPITVFGGVRPKIDAHLLPVSIAQTASNCRVASGALSPWQKFTVVNTPSKTGTKISIYRIPYAAVNYWLHWTTDVDMVKGQIANDAFNRYYYTGAGEPRATTDALATQGAGTAYPLAYFTLGLPVPPTPTISGIAGGAGINQTRSYVITDVTLWGEEGPPSLPVTSTGKVDATWTLATLHTAQPAGGTYQVVSKNIYRTVLASDGTSTWLFVANVLLATATFADSVLDAALTTGTVLPSTNWVAPPTNMSGLIALPNGSMAGFSGNQLCISEPFQPHAWPLAYRYSVDFPIVGIKANGTTIAVCTTANPYTFTGVNPDAMTPNRSKVTEPCLSKRSMVDMGWGVLYASPNGVVNALSSTSEIITANSILPKDWGMNYYPAASFGAVYQDMYHLFYIKTGGGGGIIWSKDADTNGFRQITDIASGVWRDPETAKLYAIVNGDIVMWDSDALNKVAFDWKSKVFIESKPLNYGAIKVDADFTSLSDFTNAQAQLVLDIVYNAALFAANTTGGPLGMSMLGEKILGGSFMRGSGSSLLTLRFLTIYVYADGTLIYQKNFTSKAAQKLPSGFKSEQWEVRAAGSVDVYSIKIAENAKALERV